MRPGGNIPNRNYIEIEKVGWDIMPGQEKADYGVSQSCSDGIEILIKK